jgi:O-antigen ligase
VILALRRFFSLFIFLVGAVALVLPRGYSLGFFLTCLFGLLLWLPERENLIDLKNKWLVLPCIVYAFGHMVIGLAHQWAWRSLDPYVPFLLLAICVWGIRKYRPNVLFFWSGLAVGSMGAACFAGYQSLVLGVRAGGFNHPIQFGNVALLMGVLCLVRLLTVRGNLWMDVLMLVGFGSGLAASVWSQTRGGWVAVLLILGWMLHKVTQNWIPAKRALAAVVMFTVLAIPALQSNGIVQNRVITAVTEFEGYLESNTQGTSVGARLAMWKFALKDIAAAPFIGHGTEGWKRSRDAGIESGALDPFLKDFSHLHNEFFDVTYKTGLIGLSLLLALYWGPMLMFFKTYLHGFGQEAHALAIGGMVLPMMFMDFGLTQTFLSHNSGRMVFVSMLMCLGGLVLNAAEDNEAHDAT